ncbi:hypothetical protein VTH06DRAFT_968 [Thermothelomyces fergusii]
MSVPSSPASGAQPLQPVSPNAQRESAFFASAQHHRDRLSEIASTRESSVHEKINQFNSLAMQSKVLERKTADAALKRAVLGREEAEAEARRWRDKVDTLTKEVDTLTAQLQESRDRERKVSERLEAVMENYAQMKETQAHTKQAYEKELRRIRKETFKVQSSLVTAQEELKSCRTALRASEEQLQAERERSQALEREAVDAKSKLAELQEQLDQALGKTKMLEQELEAVKTLAKKETEAKRQAPDDDDDWANSEGPRKRARRSSLSAIYDGDPEIERITMLWEWEKQRADRALEQVAPTIDPRKRASMFSDAGDPMILSESRRASAEAPKPLPGRSKTDLLKGSKESRRSTIFLPEEGIFRTVSQAEADAIAAKSAGSSGMPPAGPAASLPITSTDSDHHYHRTPSVDPPDFAVPNKERISLLSLLEAPHRQESPPTFSIPTTPGPAPEARHEEPARKGTETAATKKPSELTLAPRQSADSLDAPLSEPLPSRDVDDKPTAAPRVRPHTTASYYPTTTTATTTVTITKVPLRSEPTAEDGPTLAQRLLRAQRTPARQTGRIPAEDGFDLDRPSFDVTDPALTPTMTREQALAQIRERRGRARSVGRVGNGGSSASGSGNGATASSSSSSSFSSSSGSTGSGASQGDARRKMSSGGAPAGAAARRPGSSFERVRERGGEPLAGVRRLKS